MSGTNRRQRPFGCFALLLDDTDRTGFEHQTLAVALENVADQDDKVGLLRLDLVDPRGKPCRAQERAEMQVRDGDKHRPVERHGQSAAVDLIALYDRRAQPLNESQRGESHTDGQCRTAQLRRSLWKQQTKARGRIHRQQRH